MIGWEIAGKSVRRFPAFATAQIASNFHKSIYDRYCRRLEAFVVPKGRDLASVGMISPMGWDALEQWGDDVARIEPLAGGVANEVWSVRINGRLAVARRGVRSDADLAWEA